MKIYSIYGQCESAAAEVMIEAGKARKIPVEEIPQEELKHPVTGQRALFAVMVPTPYEADFEELCDGLRA